MAGTNTRMPTGVYCANPDGNHPDAMAYFEDRFNRHVAIMGRPVAMNAFTDFSQDPSTWGDNAAWTAWSWMQSKVGLSTVRPIVGVKLADNAHFFPNSNAFYLDIIAGKHDAHYAAVATAWAKAGFKDVALRIGYEFDGKFMPDYQGEDASTQANWVQAFRRVSGIMRNAFFAAGGTRCARVWNPASMNWTALKVADSYPGDDVVDVISLDVYSPCYNGSLYNYDAPTYSFAASQADWLARVENRRHYWTWPSANEWNQQGNGSGFGIRDAVAMCVAHKKALAISECGMGSANPNVGLVDDSAFPAWLKGELDLAGKQGVAISHVMVWDANMGDGPWSFLPEDNKPLVAAAWAKNFGAYPAS